MEKQEAHKYQYITTTLPYVNSDPHLGFAMEIIRADIVARIKREQGFDVFFNTGTDEHGQKIYQKAEELGKTPKDHVDFYSSKFKNLLNTLNIQDAKFIRTTDESHMKSAQLFWKKCMDNGYIYKKNYTGMYCSGCEMFIPEKDIVDGKCSIHINRELEEIEEENYFFKLSAFQDKLKEHFENNPDFVIPASRHKEMLSMINSGLEDFSISRLASKSPWGIGVPDDSDQTIYVWFDALVNYISTLGWPEDEENFDKYWVNGSPIQYCGKDNTQHQSVRWQAMLMSVDLPLSKNIVVDGFISSDGQKMSKSLGNVIDPNDVVEKYGTDALRYFVARELHSFEDGDVTMDKIHESYTAHLVNGIGNLASRILQMANSYCDNKIDVPEVSLSPEFLTEIESFNLQKAYDLVWKKIGEMDERIAIEKPFSVAKEDRFKAGEIVSSLVVDLAWIARHVEALMPETSIKIQEAISKQAKPEKSLFERIEK